MRLDNRRTDPRKLREIANMPHVQDEARKLATDIRDDARRTARTFRRTGRMARHIKVEEITDLETGIEGFAVGWDDPAFYGPFVEGGTEDTAPRPHLVPAAIKHGASVRGGDR